MVLGSQFSVMIYSFILILAEEGAAHSESGGFMAWWHKTGEQIFNYPGFEAWKFFNLAVFVALMIYLLRKPLSGAFRAKRDAIRAELIRAEEAKQSALARLTETEAKLARQDAEASDIARKAEAEANVEKMRITEQTEFEVKRMREQAGAEVERVSKQAKLNLRRYSAEESIRLAEEKIKAGINADNDARLVKANIESIGGLNR